jgi:heat-inducible transcriptional repressor
MRKVTLDERKRAILRAVVHDFITTAEPVSSRAITEKYRLEVSPATVRHELGILEGMGYLRQPHTSAGRIPTDLGYRFYVDTLSVVRLNAVERATIDRIFATVSKEIEDLMSETSVLLSRMTLHTGIVFAPALGKSAFKHINLVLLSSDTVLMVLITDTGFVEKQLLELKSEVTPGDLVQVESVLNQHLARLNIDQVKTKHGELLKHAVNCQDLLKEVFGKIVDQMDKEESKRIFLGGTFHFLREPEFESVKRVQDILEALERRYVLLRLLGDTFTESQVVVRIGSENQQSEIKDCSYVAANYRFGGKSLGTLGILGPTRMDYAHVISTVKYFADTLSQVLESLHQ